MSLTVKEDKRDDKKRMEVEEKVNGHKGGR